MDNIKNNINKIINDIRKAEIKSGRSEGSVQLLAVSKFHPVDSIIEAIKSGQKYFGENRVQEAYSKFVEIKKMYDDIELHIIGQLQSNKVKKAIPILLNKLRPVRKADNPIRSIETIVPEICASRPRSLQMLSIICPIVQIKPPTKKALIQFFAMGELGVFLSTYFL